MCSTRDPIHALQRYIEEWGLTSEQEPKVLYLLYSLPTRYALLFGPQSNSTRTQKTRLTLPSRRPKHPPTAHQGPQDRRLLQGQRASLHARPGA